MSDTVAHLARVTAASSLEELWDMHTAKMAEYGFDRLIYGYTYFRVENNLGDPDDFIVLSNHSREYLDNFLDNRMFINAPMSKWALENEGACSWGYIAERAASGAASKEELAAVEYNHRMGVTAGYTVSFRSISHRCKGAIGLAGARGMTQADLDAIWAEHGTDIRLMNDVLHLKVLNLPHVNEKRILTKRQREVLEWVGDGKTTQDIATLLGRTPATVEKHLRLARESLNVETTTQAVLKAAFQNQIFIVES